MSARFVYKIMRADEWARASAAGAYEGSADDQRDGFIHFSTAAQLVETLARHYAGQDGLTLLEIAAAGLGEALRWEPSRGGALFPHLYAPLAARDVARAWPLTRDAHGVHVLPEDVRA